MESRKPRSKPNYFIAIQIRSAEIRNKIIELQKHLVYKQKSLETVLNNPNTLHVSLMVMHLTNDEQLRNAYDAFAAVEQKLNGNPDMKSIHLSFRGIGNFNGKVIYVKPVEDENLENFRKLATTVAKTCAEYGILSSDSRPFSPHLTVGNLSKDYMVKKYVGQFRPEWYNQMLHDVFGSDFVTSIQICSMELPKQELSGYYHVVKEIFL